MCLDCRKVTKTEPKTKRGRILHNIKTFTVFRRRGFRLREYSSMTKPYLCSLIILPTLPTQIIYMLSKEKRREVQYRKLDEEVGT